MYYLKVPLRVLIESTSTGGWSAESVTIFIKGNWSKFRPYFLFRRFLITWVSCTPSNGQVQRHHYFSTLSFASAHKSGSLPPVMGVDRTGAGGGTKERQAQSSVTTTEKARIVVMRRIGQLRAQPQEEREQTNRASASTTAEEVLLSRRYFFLFFLLFFYSLLDYKTTIKYLDLQFNFLWKLRSIVRDNVLLTNMLYSLQCKKWAGRASQTRKKVYKQCGGAGGADGAAPPASMCEHMRPLELIIPLTEQDPWPFHPKCLIWSPERNDGPSTTNILGETNLTSSFPSTGV